ncbi:hypothetical protein FRC02_006828, partial [Tulasnella sp. 418]
QSAEGLPSAVRYVPWKKPIIRARWVCLDATSSTREGAPWTTISPTPFLPPSSWISIVAPPVFIKDWQ